LARAAEVLMLVVLVGANELLLAAVGGILTDRLLSVFTLFILVHRPMAALIFYKF